MKRRIIVSDHAVLRYLERIIGLDLDQIRAKLASEIAAAAATGARTVTTQGTTYVFEKTPNGDICVVTVLTEKMRRATHHRRAHRGKPVTKPAPA
jgi:hypothetical protein